MEKRLSGVKNLSEEEEAREDMITILFMALNSRAWNGAAGTRRT